MVTLTFVFTNGMEQSFSGFYSWRIVQRDGFARVIIKKGLPGDPNRIEIPLTNVAYWVVTRNGS